MSYSPSIWDTENNEGRRAYLYSLCMKNRTPMQLKRIAILISRLAKEEDEAERIVDTDYFHDSKYRRILTDDIAEINHSDKYPGIIVHDSQGVYFGDRQTAVEYVDKAYAEGIRKLALAQKMAKKLALDGQYKLDQTVVDAYERSRNDSKRSGV